MAVSKNIKAKFMAFENATGAKVKDFKDGVLIIEYKGNILRLITSQLEHFNAMFDGQKVYAFPFIISGVNFPDSKLFFVDNNYHVSKQEIEDYKEIERMVKENKFN